MSDGRRQILSFLLPGDIVSSVLVFDPVSRCSVETISELRYRTFARDTIKALMLQHPALLELMNRVREDETARSAYLAVGLGQRTAAERIAALLLSLADRLARRGMMRGATMDFPLRQHHVADATGLTVVHAGNMLNEFRRAGLIDISDRALTFLDAPGLRRVSGQF
jgi:CRP-like cAMP-binding protein